MYLLTIVINKMHKEKVKRLRKIQKQGMSLSIFKYYDILFILMLETQKKQFAQKVEEQNKQRIRKAVTRSRLSIRKYVDARRRVFHNTTISPGARKESVNSFSTDLKHHDS